MESFGYLVMAFMGGVAGYYLHRILKDKGKVE